MKKETNSLLQSYVRSVFWIFFGDKKYNKRSDENLKDNLQKANDCYNIVEYIKKITLCYSNRPTRCRVSVYDKKVNPPSVPTAVRYTLLRKRKKELNH